MDYFESSLGGRRVKTCRSGRRRRPERYAELSTSCGILDRLLPPVVRGSNCMGYDRNLSCDLSDMCNGFHDVCTLD